MIRKIIITGRSFLGSKFSEFFLIGYFVIAIDKNKKVGSA